MPLQTRLNFPVRKQGGRSKTSENCSPVKESVLGVKRALFGEAQSPASSKRARNGNENCDSPKKSSLKNLDENSPLVKAKQAFHTGLPSRLIGRSKEIADIHCFLSSHINNSTSGSLYMSGAPGTGKTSSLMFVMKNFEKKISFAFVNCMTVNNPVAIYRAIGKELGMPAKTVSSKNIEDVLMKKMTTSDSPVVLVLDEIDQLDCKDQHVLYTLFEWPHLPKSKLILIGIANALDLTDRILPRLHTFKCQPKLMHFQPYNKDQIVSILEDRLSEVQSSGVPVIKPLAVQLCARKIAANTGDIRKALDVCRRAVEIVENRIHKQQLIGLKSTCDDRCNPGSPTKRSAPSQTVDIMEINSVLQEVYGSRLQTLNLSSSSSETVTMPLQHMLLLCTVVLMKKHCKLQDMTLGKAYDTYKKICTKRDIAVVDECAFHGLCKLVESRGFIQLKPLPSKIARLTKVCLKLEENEAEDVMQDKALLPSILADRSVLFK